MKQATLFEREWTFTDRDVKSVTFQGKLSRPIHRWYRLTPSFSPRLATDIADYLELGRGDHVLDPFSGVGTVPLCMKYRAIPASAIEINPYLHFVSSVKTRTYQELDAIDKCFKAFLRRFRRVHRLPQSKKEAREYLSKHSRFVPMIHRPGRWWSPGNLMQLVALRKLLLDYSAESYQVDLLRMGALSILISVSNARHNHVSLTFAEEPLATVNVAEILELKYSQMIHDLRAVSTLPVAEVFVHRGDSKNAADVLGEKQKVSAVITSPPYPNRFSYARETRPHLFFFDFVPHAKAVGDLETKAIGGTWGKATSVLSRLVEPTNEAIASLLTPYTNNINGKGRLMANYVTKYFNDMYAHALQMWTVCRRGARLAYVIGNSKFYGHPLPSDQILAAIFGLCGFDLVKIERMRRRQSKTGLYEAVVFMAKT